MQFLFISFQASSSETEPQTSHNTDGLLATAVSDITAEVTEEEFTAEWNLLWLAAAVYPAGQEPAHLFSPVWWCHTSPDQVLLVGHAGPAVGQRHVSVLVQAEAVLCDVIVTVGEEARRAAAAAGGAGVRRRVADVRRVGGQEGDVWAAGGRNVWSLIWFIKY